MCQESRRLYCDKTKIFNLLVQEEVDAKVREKQEDLTRRRKPRVPTEELTEAIQREQIVPFILARLVIIPKEQVERLIEQESLQETNDLRSKVESLKGENTEILSQSTDFQKPIITFRVACVEISGDKQFNFLIPKPLDLDPIHIPRRSTRITLDEFKIGLKSFNSETLNLNSATMVAGKAAGLAQSAVAGFQISAKKYDESLMSIAQIRWQKACHKVVLNNAVAFYRKQLEKFASRSMGSLPVGMFKSKARDPLRQESRGTFPSPSVIPDNDILPGIQEFSPPRLNANGELVNAQGKKIIRVMSKYSKVLPPDLALTLSCNRLPLITELPVINERRRSRATSYA